MYGAVIYRYIAAVLRRWWAVLMCAFLLVSTSLVRVFAGAHFVLDVLGGLLFGFLLLLLFFLAGPRAERYAGSLSPGGRYAGIILLSLLPILLAAPAYLSLAGWQLPASWTGTAHQQIATEIAPVSILYAWGAAGIILGSLAGYEILLSQGGWAPPSDPLKKGVVILAGTASVLILNAVIAAIRSVPDLSSPFDQAARVLLHGARIVLAHRVCTADCPKSRVCGGGTGNGNLRHVKKWSGFFRIPFATRKCPCVRESELPVAQINFTQRHPFTGFPKPGTDK